MSEIRPNDETRGERSKLAMCGGPTQASYDSAEQIYFNAWDSENAA